MGYDDFDTNGLPADKALPTGGSWSGQVADDHLVVMPEAKVDPDEIDLGNMPPPRRLSVHETLERMREAIADASQLPGQGILPRREAYIWWCGDEECDCYQPVIVLLERRGGTVTRTTEWQGEFKSWPSTTECEAQRRELVIECARRSIPMDEDDQGEQAPAL